MADKIPKRTSYSSALVALVVTDHEGADHPDYTYVVENFSADRQFNNELQPAIGHFNPVNNLVHGASASFSWGMMLTSVSLTGAKLVPKPSELGKWNPFTMKVIDLVEGKLLCQLVKCAISSDGRNGAANSAMKVQIQGTSTQLMDPEELN